MQWVIAALVLGVAVQVARPAATATAAGTGSCPPAFHLHTVADDDHEHGPHRHVGVRMEQVDRNGNGVVCVKHVAADGDIHVHIDDRTVPGRQ